MPDFEQTLNDILSNPAAMEQIAQLAQALNTPSAAVSQNAQAPQNVRAVSQNAQAAQNVQATAQNAQNIPSDAPDMLSDVPENRTAAPSLGELSAALSGSQALIQFLPLLRELAGQQDSNARRLLYALRPYLNPRRQEKMERALQLAKVCHIGKKFLLEWGNQGV